MSSPARRIISLAPALTDTLFSLGLGESVVGVTAQCNHPDASRCPRVGSFGQPEVSVILAQRPDLVLSMGPIHSSVEEELRRHDIPVLPFRPASVSDIFAEVEELCRLAGNEERCLRRIAALRARLRAVQEQVRGLAPVRAFRLLSVDPLIALGPSTYHHDAMVHAGGLPLPVATEQPATVISLADLVTFDPEVIVACGRNSGEVPRPLCPGCRSEAPICVRDVSTIGTLPGWQDMTAAKAGRISALPCEILCRPGPGLIGGIERMAALFHPMNG